MEQTTTATTTEEITTMVEMFEISEANEFDERTVSLSGEVVGTISEVDGEFFAFFLLTDDLNEEPADSLDGALEILAEMIDAATDED